MQHGLQSSLLEGDSNATQTSILTMLKKMVISSQAAQAHVLINL